MNELIFSVLFGVYFLAFFMYSMFFYWSFRAEGIKNSLIYFATGNYCLNAILLVLFIPSVLVGMLSLKIEKMLRN